MSKQEPPIQKFMTCLPKVIDAGATAEAALHVMRENKIRHLPVMEAGQVKGLLSERDLKTALGLRGADAAQLKVSDICTDHPYVTEPQRPLSEVAAEMAAHHYGSAIVVQNRQVVGIFTAVDACRALHDVLQTRYHA
ncbi:MAG: CBS domain-containing protein [Candidatus Omnitrophica bacterium]|nr:CBS domain-containing protein [Candidatus Omnitrophota bacterium]